MLTIISTTEKALGAKVVITAMIFHMGLAFNCQQLPGLVVTNNRLLRRSGENFSPLIKVAKACGSPCYKIKLEKTKILNAMVFMIPIKTYESKIHQSRQGA